MGFTCSVLGHRYGERERIEERDRQGSEVVAIVREVKTCERCGQDLVVSESKEVTAAAEATPDSDPVDPEDPPETAETTPDEIEVAEPEAEADDGIILPNEPTDRELGEWPAPSPEPERTSESTVEWPRVEREEADDSGADFVPAWPKTAGEDEGFDAVAGSMDHEDGGQLIEPVEQSARSTEPKSAQSDDGFARAAPIDDPTDPAPSDLHAEYFCPQCDWTAESLKTSVRRGDVCPACRRGYVAERDIT